MIRRSFLSGAVSVFVPLALPVPASASTSVTAQIAQLEAYSGGRLGIYAIDTGNSQAIAHRSDERFLMCSTFKLLAAAAVLTNIDRGRERLDRRVRYGKADMQEYAPVAKQNLARGFMTVGALCEAAIEYSDNTAANLLLSLIGGPKGWTQYARSLGDPVSRLDRMEPELNRPVPGSILDTTTPAAMAANMQRVLLGSALSPASRARLLDWLVKSKTGDDLIRAGVPHSWRVGDKTGLGGGRNARGDSDTRDDLAILWPPHRAPILIAAYLTKCKLPATQRDAIQAQAGRIVSTAFVH